MADIQIQHEDLLRTVQAQRDEALNSAAHSGAAVRSLMRENEGLKAQLAAAQSRIAELEDAAETDRIARAA